MFCELSSGFINIQFCKYICIIYITFVKWVNIHIKNTKWDVNRVLKKEGVLSGSSSGTLISAAIKYCKEQTESKNVVTLVCDTGNKYLKIYDRDWLSKNNY